MESSTSARAMATRTRSGCDASHRPARGPALLGSGHAHRRLGGGLQWNLPRVVAASRVGVDLKRTKAGRADENLFPNEVALTRVRIKQLRRALDDARRTHSI